MFLYPAFVSVLFTNPVGPMGPGPPLDGGSERLTVEQTHGQTVGRKYDRSDLIIILGTVGRTGAGSVARTDGRSDGPRWSHGRTDSRSNRWMDGRILPLWTVAKLESLGQPPDSLDCDQSH